jgi:hypothetical protein
MMKWNQKLVVANVFVMKILHHMVLDKPELGYHLFLVVVVFVVVIQTIRMQIATFIMLSRAKKGMLRGGVSFPF